VTLTAIAQSSIAQYLLAAAALVGWVAVTNLAVVGLFITG
jgi:hypothetical protein